MLTTRISSSARLSEAQGAFLQYLLSRKNRSASTVETYDKILRQFIEVTGDLSVSELTLDEIDHYADVLFNRGCVVKTRRNKLATIRSFVRWMYIKDITGIKPEQVELPTVKRIEANFLTTEEAKKLISVISDTRDRAMLLTLLTTWARITEFLNLNYEDLYKKSIIIRAGKGGDPRVVFINEETDKAIQKYIDEVRGSLPGPLFKNRYGGRLSREFMGKLIKRYSRLAGITKNVSCHTLRHTGATGFLEDGGTLEGANQILGHKSIYTTMIYLHFLDARLHKDYDKVVVGAKYTI